jgi:hypothetical protein
LDFCGFIITFIHKAARLSTAILRYPSGRKTVTPEDSDAPA